MSICIKKKMGRDVIVDKHRLVVMRADADVEDWSESIARIASLLAFMEASEGTDANEPITVRRSQAGDGVRFFARDLHHAAAFERWFCDRILNMDDSIEPLREFLRAQEAYLLVRFLLCSFDDHSSVAGLASRYGLSTSHFRRICRGIFGGGLKSRLRQWRAQSALHDLLSGAKSVAELAYQHGFASSSHFSQEMKFHFGARPGRQQ